MDPQCVRCSRGVVARDEGGWFCDKHGAVEALTAPVGYDPATLAAVQGSEGVPVWVPWPLAPDWVVVGLRSTDAGAEPVHAMAVSCAGPGMLGESTHLVVVAEEPGVGLGARFAGRAEADPGPALTAGPPETRVTAAGHPTPLWSLPAAPDRAVYVGEALGCWLWVVVWPATEFMMVHNKITLVDLRDGPVAYDLPTGQLTGPILE
jgi:hypothetical protein